MKINTVIFLLCLVLLNIVTAIFSSLKFDSVIDLTSILIITIFIIVISGIHHLLSLYFKKYWLIIPVAYFVLLLVLIVYFFIIYRNFAIEEGVLFLNILVCSDLPLLFDEKLISFGIPEVHSYILSQIFFPPLFILLLIKLSDVISYKWKKLFN